MRKGYGTWHRTLFGWAWLLALALPVSAWAQAWQARHDLDDESLRMTIDQLRGDRLVPSALSAYRVGSHLRYAGLWDEYDGDWKLLRNLSQAKLEETTRTLDRQGYAPLRLEAHSENGQVTYSGLWLSIGADDRQARVGMTAVEFQAEFERQLAAGRYSLQVRPYDAGGQLRYLAVFGAPPPVDWQVRHNLSPAAYQRTTEEMKAAGFIPVQVHGAHAGGEVKYAAIWHRNTQGVPWKARHGMDTATYAAHFKQSVADGYHLLHVDAFDVDGSPSFATLWYK